MAILHGHEQSLGDLAVGHPGGGHLSHAPFAGNECLDAGEALAAGPRGGRAGRVHRSTVRRLGAVPDGPPGRVGGPVAPAVVVASAGGSYDRDRGGRNASGASAGEVVGEFINRAPKPRT